MVYPMLDAFDAPNPQETCSRRFRSVIPSQALMMMNDTLVGDWARALAGRVLNDGGLSLDQQVDRAYRLALSRPPGCAARPWARKNPHHPATAKSVIFCFMEGGPSHVDLFDPKPTLTKLDGKPVPDSIGKPSQTSRGTGNNTLMASRRKWKQYGQSGLWAS